MPKEVKRCLFKDRDPLKIIPYLGGTDLSYSPHNMGVPTPGAIPLVSNKHPLQAPCLLLNKSIFVFFLQRGILQVG